MVTFADGWSVAYLFNHISFIRLDDIENVMLLVTYLMCWLFDVLVHVCISHSLQELRRLVICPGVAALLRPVDCLTADVAHYNDMRVSAVVCLLHHV